jgi:ribosome-associated translation inhibitor RaiA
MQVLLNTDHHTHGSHEMADHLTVVVKDAVAQFGEHVTRVVAHIADENGSAKTTPDEIQCTLEARLVGLEPVVVKDRAGSVHQAIHGAAAKLKRAVGTVLAKHDPRHTQPHAPDLPDELA